MKKWKEVANEEYHAFMKNMTQDLTELPKERKAIRSKWVFCIKRKTNGKVDKYYVRLIAQGLSQTKGLDFYETFAPIVKFFSFRVLLALATTFDLEIHRMNVKNVFLNIKLEEDIYMM